MRFSQRPSAARLLRRRAGAVLVVPTALGVLLAAPAAGSAATGVEAAPEATVTAQVTAAAQASDAPADGGRGADATAAPDEPAEPGGVGAQGLPDPGPPPPGRSDPEPVGAGSPEEAICAPAAVINLPGGGPAHGAVPAYTVGQALSFAATGWCRTPGTALPDPEITVNLHGPDEVKRYETGQVLILVPSGEDAGSAIGDLPFEELLEVARAFNHGASIPRTGTFSLTLASDGQTVTTGVFTVSEAAPQPSPSPTEPAPSPSPEPGPDPLPDPSPTPGPSASPAPEPTEQPSTPPSPEPTEQPSASPAPEPSPQPMPPPTARPTAEPTTGAGAEPPAVPGPTPSADPLVPQDPSGPDPLQPPDTSSALSKDSQDEADIAPPAAAPTVPPEQSPQPQEPDNQAPDADAGPVQAGQAQSPASDDPRQRPAGTPRAPVASASELSADNAGSLSGARQGSLVTLILPSSAISQGEWVSVFVFPGARSPGWVQVDSTNSVAIDISTLDSGSYELVVADRDNVLLGWARLEIAEASHRPGGMRQARVLPGAHAAAGPGYIGPDDWLLIGAGGLLVLGAASLLVAARSGAAALRG